MSDFVLSQPLVCNPPVSDLCCETARSCGTGGEAGSLCRSSGQRPRSTSQETWVSFLLLLTVWTLGSPFLFLGAQFPCLTGLYLLGFLSPLIVVIFTASAVAISMSSFDWSLCFLKACILFIIFPRLFSTASDSMWLSKFYTGIVFWCCLWDSGAKHLCYSRLNRDLPWDWEVGDLWLSLVCCQSAEPRNCLWGLGVSLPLSLVSDEMD